MTVEEMRALSCMLAESVGCAVRDALRSQADMDRRARGQSESSARSENFLRRVRYRTLDAGAQYTEATVAGAGEAFTVYGTDLGATLLVVGPDGEQCELPCVSGFYDMPHERVLLTASANLVVPVTVFNGPSAVLRYAAPPPFLAAASAQGGLYSDGDEARPVLTLGGKLAVVGGERVDAVTTGRMTLLAATPAGAETILGADGAVTSLVVKNAGANPVTVYGAGQAAAAGFDVDAAEVLAFPIGQVAPRASGIVFESASGTDVHLFAVLSGDDYREAV